MKLSAIHSLWSRCLVVITLPLLLFGCVSLPPDTPTWRMVAEADLIVKGRLAPFERPAQPVTNGTPDQTQYYTISIQQVYKGKVKASQIRIQLEGEDRLQLVSGLLQKEGIFFLAESMTIGFHGYDPLYRCPVNPCMSSSSPAESIIQKEIEDQTFVLNHFNELHSPSDTQSLHRVRNLITEALVPATQYKAYEQLSNLDTNYIEAVIFLLDDRRPLLSGSFGFKDESPSAWEGVVHYDPKKVVDLLASVLSIITHESFGFIAMGGTEQDRKKVVDGWRLYYHYEIAPKKQTNTLSSVEGSDVRHSNKN